MKYLLAILAGLAPLAVVSAVDASKVFFAAAPAPESEDPVAASSAPREAAEAAESTQSEVTAMRPGVQALLSAAAQPYEIGASVLLDGSAPGLSDLAASWSRLREALILCEQSVPALAAELPTFDIAASAPESAQELRTEIDRHVSRNSLVKSRLEEVAAVQNALSEASLASLDDLVAMIATRHAALEREQKALEQAVAMLEGAQKKTAEVVANDQANQKRLSEAERRLSSGAFSEALVELEAVQEPTSASVLQQTRDKQAEIERLWLEQTRDQVEQALRAKDFDLALARLGGYRGGKTEQSAQLRKRIDDLVIRENDTCWAHATQAYRDGDYLGSFDFLMKCREPKPKDWEAGVHAALDRAAEALLQRTAKIQGFQPQPDWIALRDDLTRFVQKVERANVRLPELAVKARGELQRLDAAFRAAELLQTTPPRSLVGDWAARAAALTRQHPDNRLKAALQTALVNSLKAELNVDNPSDAYIAAGNQLVNNMGRKDRWELFQQALRGEQDVRYSKAKQTVQSVLDAWPSVEAILTVQ